MADAKTELKPTKDPRIAWWTLAALLAIMVMFALVIVPLMRPKQRDAKVGRPAPDFSLEVIHGGDAGNRIRLSTLRGKAVLLDFWASWCAPCREQMPIVERMTKKFGENELMVVGVDTSDSRADATEFLKARPPGYPSLFDEGGFVAKAYDVTAIPVVVVVDREGVISAVRRSIVPEAELEQLIRDALGS
jgi:cytochrome c biogenesis protein CcmG, thiol:disulfide interchange protein DsbE